MNIVLKSKRKERGLTQEQVAQKSGVAVRTYQNYEADERVPDVQTAIQIADVLKVKSYKEFKALFGAVTPDNKLNGNQAD